MKDVLMSWSGGKNESNPIGRENGLVPRIAGFQAVSNEPA
jgi:hypothetical protein